MKDKYMVYTQIHIYRNNYRNEEGISLLIHFNFNANTVYVPVGWILSSVITVFEIYIYILS